MQVTSLSTLNERLNRLAQDLRAENSNLQGALERAAAERKSLEAAAALQAAHAQSGALVEVAAAHSGRVVDEVAGLALGQQQLVALVCELREDLLGLVAHKDDADADNASVLVSTAASAASAELADALAAGSSSGAALGWLAGAAEEQAAAAAAANTAEAKQLRSCSPSSAAAADEANGDAGKELACVANGSSSSSSSGVLCKPAGLRLKSVRGSVDAALAASIAGTLQL